MMNPIFAELAQRAGVHFEPGVDFQATTNVRTGGNGYMGLACDAQPSLVTVSNAGIPAFLTTYLDKNVIDVLLSPMKFAEILGEEKKGDWTTETAIFQIAESTGQTTSYADHSNTGSAGVNVNYPQRQSYHYQTITQWGERELARAGAAGIDWANRQNIASVLTLNKFQNKSYAFGIAGLQNYGLLNDPSLSAPIAPNTKAAGGTGWQNATANEQLKDVQKLYNQLQLQTNGLLELDSPMQLLMSPTSQGWLANTTDFNVTTVERLKKIYPNMEIMTAPEYATQSGQLVQLVLKELEGQKTASACFTEKLRAHAVVTELSSFKQKKSQGTWGTIIYRPFCIAAMLGV